MDILVVGSSAYTLPSNRRAGALIFDGTTAFDLYRTLSSDRDLLRAYGPTLETVLNQERNRLPGKQLDPGNLLRIHPGQLHCDMLLWVALRSHGEDPEKDAAIGNALIQEGVSSALRFAAERHVTRVAIPPLCSPAQRDTPDGKRLALERLVATAKACQQILEAGESGSIEEVLLCVPDKSLARTLSHRLNQNVLELSSGSSGESKSRSTARTRRTSSAKGRTGGRSKRLTEQQLSEAAAYAKPYNIRACFEQGDWIDHKKFGYGLIEAISPDGFVQVRFADGSERKLVHNR